MEPIYTTQPEADLVAYHLGWLYLRTPEGWYADDLMGRRMQIRTSIVPDRYVLGQQGLILLAAHGLVLVQDGAVREYVGLEKAWAPLGHACDGSYTLEGMSLGLRDRSEAHGLPLTSAKTWWVSGQFGLKVSAPVIGGRPGDAVWVFGTANPFVYWHGILGQLVFGSVPKEAVPYTDHIPIIAAQDRYYFSRDGDLWFSRTVDGFPFVTPRGMVLYRRNGEILPLKGWI